METIVLMQIIASSQIYEDHRVKLQTVKDQPLQNKEVGCRYVVIKNNSTGCS